VKKVWILAIIGLAVVGLITLPIVVKPVSIEYYCNPTADVCAEQNVVMERVEKDFGLYSRIKFYDMSNRETINLVINSEVYKAGKIRGLPTIIIGKEVLTDAGSKPFSYEQIKNKVCSQFTFLMRCWI
jgi:hypothetical protein